MTTAPTTRCPTCSGAWHRYDDGCPRCGDAGTVELDDEPAPHVPFYAIERATVAIRDALARRGWYASERAWLAETYARYLASEPVLRSLEPAMPVVSVMLPAYLAAIREHARVVRPSGPASGWTARQREAAAVADACDAHARRIEMALPVWARMEER